MKTLLKYLIALGIMVIIVSLAIDSVIMNVYVRRGQSRYLMNVENRSLDQALVMLKSEGFRGIVSDTLYTNNFEPNAIIDQYPKPNTKVKPGRTVRLKIVRPEKLVVVPNLIGQSYRSAEIILHRIGLVIDTVYTEYNPDYPKGTIAWQSPKGGDYLPKSHGVHFTLSEGLPPDSYHVPNLFGLSKTKAETELEKAGLKMGKIYYQQNEDLIPYTVLNQSVTAGTVLDRSIGIDITVSVIDMQDIFNQLINE